MSIINFYRMISCKIMTVWWIHWCVKILEKICSKNVVYNSVIFVIICWKEKKEKMENSLIKLMSRKTPGILSTPPHHLPSSPSTKTAAAAELFAAAANSPWDALYTATAAAPNCTTTPKVNNKNNLHYLITLLLLLFMQ